MRFIFALIAICLSGTLLAEDAAATVDAAINRGLDFLVKDARRWQQDHQCVSCHHAALVAWSMIEARQRQRTIDEPVLKELIKWIAESGDGQTSVPRPANVPRALNTKAVYFALALSADPVPDSLTQTGLNRLLTTVKEDQLDDGSWAAWPETRPPFFGDSNESMTALATLATLTAASTDASIGVVRDKGIGWLAKTKTDDDPQSNALRLVLWHRMGQSTDECEPLVRRIKQRQNEDGGWSQSAEMPSDAWATGQALYALAESGITANEPLIVRAHAFLVKTQREDGAWPMTSRPTKPGGQGSNSLIPIIGGGSAWAILGLVRSS